MGAEVGSLPGLDAFSHMGRSAFGATAHDDVHDAFMTLPPYTRTSEDEVHELGLGVRNCSHRASSDPLSEQSECIERACEATSAYRSRRHPFRLSPLRQARRYSAGLRPAFHWHHGPLGSNRDRWFKLASRGTLYEHSNKPFRLSL